jgi:hypothetical protein
MSWALMKSYRRVNPLRVAVLHQEHGAHSVFHPHEQERMIVAEVAQGSIFEGGAPVLTAICEGPTEV